MPRIRLKKLEELDQKTKAVVQKMESEGKDTSTIKGLANNQALFDSYFKFYGPAREKFCLGRAHRTSPLEDCPA